MTLGAIIFTQIGMAMNSRKGRGSIFQIKPFANRIISLGIVLEIVLFIILSYVPLFHTLLTLRLLDLMIGSIYSLVRLLLWLWKKSDIAYLIKSKSVAYLRLKQDF